MLPYAPDVEEWTEEHYNIYTLVELALGNRKEVTKQEQEELALIKNVDDLIESGDPNWLDAVRDFLGDEDIDSLEIDDEMFDKIDAEQRARGE